MFFVGEGFFFLFFFFATPLLKKWKIDFFFQTKAYTTPKKKIIPT